MANTVDPSGLGKVAVQTIEAYTKETSNDFQNTREALKEFRETLGEAARVFAQEARQHSLVIVIDELDRCRPSYAIELLEIAKHFFSGDHIVFVLAINRTELSHSVRAVYGEKFNAENYLERFFDIDFKLPDTERKQFVQGSFQAMKIDQYFEWTIDPSAKDHFPPIAKVLSIFFVRADISLRKIAQAMRRLGLIIAALPRDQLFLGWASAIALVLRTIDRELYERFIGRSADDKEVIDSIFSRTEFADIRDRHEGNLFEAVIIIAHEELRHGRIISPTSRFSSLYETYEAWAGTLPPESDLKKGELERAEAIVKIVRHFSLEWQSGIRISFPTAVERIELFSASLSPEDVPHS